MAEPPPAVSGQTNGPPPGVSGGSEGPPPGQTSNHNYNRAPRMPSSDGSSYRQPQLQAPVPATPAAPAPKARVRFDRITSMPRHNTEGQVVRADRLPQARTNVVFVCADERGGRQSVTTDDAGRFQTTLTAGNWLIYTREANGRLVYQQKVRVGIDQPTATITLVSR